MSLALVGAGPGDPGLLTCRAEDLLSRANVVVHDERIQPAVLALAADADTTLSVPNEPTVDLLLAYCRGARSVVRLYVGDPMLFGPGPAEALELSARGIRFEVVPGVSATWADPARRGLPVTDRRTAPSWTIDAPAPVGTTG